MGKSTQARGREILVEENRQFPHHVEHQHDSDCHQEHPGADFNDTDILAEPVESDQEMVEEQP